MAGQPHLTLGSQITGISLPMLSLRLKSQHRPCRAPPRPCPRLPVCAATTGPNQTVKSTNGREIVMIQLSDGPVQPSNDRTPQPRTFQAPAGPPSRPPTRPLSGPLPGPQASIPNPPQTLSQQRNGQPTSSTSAPTWQNPPAAPNPPGGGFRPEGSRPGVYPSGGSNGSLALPAPQNGNGRVSGNGSVSGNGQWRGPVRGGDPQGGMGRSFAAMAGSSLAVDPEEAQMIPAEFFDVGKFQKMYTTWVGLGQVSMYRLVL